MTKFEAPRFDFLVLAAVLVFDVFGPGVGAEFLSSAASAWRDDLRAKRPATL